MTSVVGDFCSELIVSILIRGAEEGGRPRPRPRVVVGGRGRLDPAVKIDNGASAVLEELDELDGAPVADLEGPDRSGRESRLEGGAIKEPAEVSVLSESEGGPTSGSANGLLNCPDRTVQYILGHS